MTWMQTASGVPFDLLNPRAEDVRRDDVIHHLARIGRFSGATKNHYPGCSYSVLQHCLLVMDILTSWGCPPEIVREGGWHECDEPYTGDLTRPLQQAVKAAFIEMLRHEDLGARCSTTMQLDPMQVVRVRVATVAREAFGLPLVESALVKRADNVALAIERRDLMEECSRDWQLAEFAPPGIVVGPMLDARDVEKKFRTRMDAVEASLKAEP